jgi:methyltransferase (TIGR00027 family)
MDPDMKQDRPSQTAYRVALSRAAHQILDEPRVFEDATALRIVGEAGAAEIRAGGRQFASPFARSLRAFVVARSRFAEDELAKAVARGVRQYVILGAGLDTFAYRQPYPHPELRVFEVDHPDTQAYKRRQLEANGIAAPDALSYVALDFETQQLTQRLPASGFNASEPCFFSWLGVSMYLTPLNVMASLRDVATLMAPGSGMVMDYLRPASQMGFVRRMAFRLLTLRLAAIGEPWRSSFDPQALALELKEIGFTSVEDLTDQQINQRYFGQRADGLQVASDLGHLLCLKI